MGTESDQIPLIDLSIRLLRFHETEADEEKWKDLCNKVREALECHGYFVLLCDKIPEKLLQDIFKAMETLFDLPEETKKKYCNPKPNRSYLNNNPVVPLHESFSIENEPDVEAAAQAFTQILWPEGNPSFCETLESMTQKMLEVNNTILKMVFESYGAGKYHKPLVESSTSVIRLLKYKVPPGDVSTGLGLIPHTDLNTLTILCHNDVQGLEFLNKNGEWYPLSLPKDAFTVVVGDGLKAWSNRRLVAPKHRVVMRGKRERFTFGLFSLPKDGFTIEIPQELVDHHHPLVYKPFKFSDYFNYFIKNISEDALEKFAGI